MAGKKLVQTSSLVGKYDVEGVTVTPQGVEVTEDQAREIQRRALVSGVRVIVTDVPDSAVETTSETPTKTEPTQTASAESSAPRSTEGSTRKRS